MRMRALVALAAMVIGAGCDPEEPAEATAPVTGRWQRVDQPSEWFEFAPDGTFRSRSFTGNDVNGRYAQKGGTITLTVLPEGHGATMTLSDTVLVMEEGTRYRRTTR